MSKYTQNITVADVKTGEEFKMALVKQRVKSPYDSFAMLNINNFVDLTRAMKDKYIKPSDLFVFGEILSSMENDNRCEVTAAALSREIGITLANTSTSLRRLRDIGVLVNSATYGKIQAYRISAEFIWKGQAKDHGKAYAKDVDLRNIFNASRKPKLEVVK